MSHGKGIPHGSWPTPLTAEVVLASATGLGGVAVDGADIVWSETRPEEAGRVQLVRRSASGETTELLPDGFSVRTRVHEYGGAAWWTRDAVLWFANWSDQRLYRIGADGAGPVALTPDPQTPAGDRYADGDLGPDGAQLVCIREHHLPEGRGAIDVVNEVVTRHTPQGSPPRRWCRDHRRRRAGGIGARARMAGRWIARLHQRPERLVEPVPLGPG